MKPMLAAEMPKIAADGKLYTIELRKGVKLHNGRDLDAEDVVASLKRWVEMTPRGKALAKSIASITAKGPSTVEIALNDLQPALLAHLALPSGYAGIMAKETHRQPAGRVRRHRPLQVPRAQAGPVRGADQFDGYVSRTEPANGYAGKKEAKIAELRFIPAPNANTRVEGVVAGQYHFADQLPVEANKPAQKRRQDACRC